jgi:hypothetical protein
MLCGIPPTPPPHCSKSAAGQGDQFFGAVIVASQSTQRRVSSSATGRRRDDPTQHRRSGAQIGRCRDARPRRWKDPRARGQEVQRPLRSERPPSRDRRSPGSVQAGKRVQAEALSGRVRRVRSAVQRRGGQGGHLRLRRQRGRCSSRCCEPTAAKGPPKRVLANSFACCPIRDALPTSGVV